MKQKIRIIFIFVLLLLLIVVIVIVIVIVIVSRTRSCWLGSLNINSQNIIVLAGLAAIVMLGVIWMRISIMMRRPLVMKNSGCSIVQKYYQKYRKQFLRLCCCSYHVPPGPGPGGGGAGGCCCGGRGNTGDDHYHNKSKINSNRVSKRNRSISGSSRENGNGGNIHSGNNPAANSTNSCSSSCSSGSGSNSNNCRKSNRRRRSLSGSLIWLLIGLVWLEGPLLISCKMNSSGDHMVKINSSANRIMSTEQQNKKFDILSNNKRFNKIYNKNSNNSNKIGSSSNNNNNNNNNNSGSGSGASGGTGNGANSGRNSNKNNYNNKSNNNNNSNNSKSNENKSNNTKNNKYKNNLSQSSSNEGSANGSASPTGRNSNNNNQVFYNSNSNTNTNSNSHIHNNNYNDNNNDNKFTDNNYYRYSNNYNYLDQYEIEEGQSKKQHQLEEQFYSEHQQRHRDYHYHTPVHLSDSHYERQLHQHQHPERQQQQLQHQHQHQHQQKQHEQHKKHQHQQHQQQQQPYDNVYIEDTNKRSILASIGCPNCVFNDNYNNYNNKPFISSDTSSLGTFLSASSSTQHGHQHDGSSTASESSTTSNIPVSDTDNKAQSTQYQNINRRPPTIINNNLSSDMIRLESIKRQILSKLGMKSKPNVTHPLSKQFIMDTLYRADGGDYVGVNFGFRSTTSTQTTDDYINSAALGDSDYSVNDDYNGSGAGGDGIGNNRNSDNSGSGSNSADDDHLTNFAMHNNPESSSSYVFDVSSTHIDGAGIATENDLLSSHSYQYQKNQEESFIDTDDFFGSTKEIITFAEKGKMFNGHRLIEFSSPTDQVTGQDLQIRSATIWIRIESRQQNLRRRMQARQTNETNLTIWIFQLSGDDLRDKEFDELATLSSSLSVKPNQLGWQKLDITETVRQWYSRGKSEKLRLLIDCTGCGHRYHLHLIQQDYNNGAGDDNQQQQQQQYFNQRHSRQRSQHNHQHPHHHNHQHSSYNRRLHRKQRQRSRKDRFQLELEKNSGGSDGNQSKHSSRSRISQKDKSRRKQQQQQQASNNKDRYDEVNVDPNRPFLVIYTDPNRVRRVRRRAIDCSGALNGQCCKESFYVSFKALGWDDWIIAPHGYFANYCRGDCGGPHRTPDTFQSYHTHVMEEFRKMDRLNGMQPCCAPLKFSSMSLIYYGNEGIIKRDLPKMVVDECGCP